MSKSKLTAKQEAFCLAHTKTGNASEAYRQAYDATDMSAAAVEVEASREDAIHMRGSATPVHPTIVTVGHEKPVADHGVEPGGGQQASFDCKRGNSSPLRKDHGDWVDVQSLHPPTHDGGERLIEVGRLGYGDRHHDEPKTRCRQAKVARRLAAILAADIAGYSALMGADEADTVRDLKAHQAVVLPIVTEHGGRIIDTAGDGILAEFPSILSAVECAVAIQRVMAQRNAGGEECRRMRFRIGVNQGDVANFAGFCASRIRIINGLDIAWCCNDGGKSSLRGEVRLAAGKCRGWGIR